MNRLVDLEQQLNALKDFQRRTARYVFRRLYDPEDPAHRFLVADEVGLGKTLVARGVIAQVVDHLERQGRARIDVIYLCSNAAIARQNLQRLNVTEEEVQEVVDRLVLLPISRSWTQERRFNLLPLTPGTSFTFGYRTGRWEERALLHWLVTERYGFRRARGVLRAFARGITDHDAPARFRDFRRQHRRRLDRRAVEAFYDRLEREDGEACHYGQPNIGTRLAELAEGYRALRSRYPPALDERRKALIGELRTVLAECAMHLLQPDLIILDEFQRFRKLLDTEGEDHATRLAQHLFRFADPKTNERARVLLLSATPYKMYTLSAERAAENHYQDLLTTVRFLFDDPEATHALGEELRRLRDSLVDVAQDGGRGAEVTCRSIEARLRRVMVRNERLASTPDRNGMLRSMPIEGLEVRPNDVAAFVDVSRVASHLDAGHIGEYWKSSPYLINFMESYQLKRRLRAQIQAGDPALTDLLQRCRGLLSWEDIERYEAVDPGNARLRYLLSDILERGVWRLLWLPPSLPYYHCGSEFDAASARAFTKRLIFSAWTVVPKMIASLVSYRVQRLVVGAAGPGPRRYSDPPPSRLLDFDIEGERPRAMTLFTLLHPSVVLSREADPLRLASETYGPTGGPPSLNGMMALARARVEALVGPLSARASTDGPVDVRWYWAAPLLLDREEASEALSVLYGRVGRRSAMVWTGPDFSEEPSRFAIHLDEARRCLSGELTLGAPPPDLSEVVTEIALAGPATAALRALARQGVEPVSSALQAAARIAWGFRTLFNHPESSDYIRSRVDHGLPYWRAVLHYALDGHLQAVLDEYVHVLREWRGHGCGSLSAEALQDLADVAHRAISIRASSYSVDVVGSRHDLVNLEPRRLRARFALPFGDLRGAEEKDLLRPSQVMEAFNSPFWPFVLASTSLGQEGLDFHLYSHAVVHWNLPSNVVDLEQREGRVHRYKGHAVRKNLAIACRDGAFMGMGEDPWSAMFDQALRQRGDGDSDIVPFWVFNPDSNGAQIERHVPMLPLSREVGRYRRLERSLAAYRLAFGAPRQEELLKYLDRQLLTGDARERLSAHLRVDLGVPPETPCAARPSTVAADDRSCS
jgi:hypothetical protein